MQSFQPIFEAACRRSGGVKALEEKLLPAKTPSDIASIADDRWLSQITKCVFQAGFNWRVIENKWDRFEEVFEGFDISRWVFMSEEDIDHFLKTEGIVKNVPKIRSVGENAQMLAAIRDEHGSAGAYFATWTIGTYATNIQHLQKQGSRLGGKTSQVFLRRMGVDTPVFTKDVLKALSQFGFSGKFPTSMKAWRDIQHTLNSWHRETGHSLTQLSQILAFSVD